MMDRADIAARLMPLESQTDTSNTQIRALLFRVAAFFSVFAGTTAIGLYLIRQPLGGPGGQVFLLYWLETSALMGTVAFAATSWPSGNRHPVSLLAALFLLLGAGIFPQLSWAVLVAVAAVTLTVFAGALGAKSNVRTNAVILMSPPLAACYFLQLNSMQYDSVFLPELVLSGRAFPDTLFHTALSSILVWYGKVASALDGFEPVRYHIFSHLWFGLSAKTAGINVVNGYYIGMQVLGLPLLLFGLVITTLACMPLPRQIPDIALLIATPLALLGAIERYDWMSYLESESHMVGLLLFLVGLPYLRTIADSDDTHDAPRAVVGLGYGLVLTATKISIGAIWTLSFLYIILRSRNVSKWGLAALATFLLVDGYMVLTLTLPNDNVSSTTIEPLHFIRSYTRVALVNLTPIAVAAILQIRDLRRGKARRWSEVVLLIFATTALPTLVLRIEGGSAYYFVNIGTWLAIASLSARILAWIRPQYSMAASIVAIFCIVVGIAVHPEKTTAYERLKRQRDALYLHLDPAGGAVFSGRGLFNRDTLRALAVGAGQSTGAKIGRLLDELHVSAGSNAMVTVAPEFQSYWALTRQCSVAPFLIPSFFGLPLLRGLPPSTEACELGKYYGFARYGTTSQATNMDDSSLCELVRHKGFSTLVVLRSEQEARKLECANRD